MNPPAQTMVNEALLQARANGYSFNEWTVAEIAGDLRAHDQRVKGMTFTVLTPLIEAALNSLPITDAGIRAHVCRKLQTGAIPADLEPSGAPWQAMTGPIPTNFQHGRAAGKRESCAACDAVLETGTIVRPWGRPIHGAKGLIVFHHACEPLWEMELKAFRAQHNPMAEGAAESL